MARKKKFKTRKTEVSPETDLRRFRNEIQSIEKLISGSKFGDCEDIQATLFSKLRALLCSGTRNLNPLLLRVLEQQGIKANFYSNGSYETDQTTLVSIIGSKQWSLIKSGNLKKVTINEYLEEKCHHNGYQDRWIDRNEMIRYVADEDGSHFDTEISDFVTHLRTIRINGNQFTIDQIELFMWDMIFLVGYHASYIEWHLKLKEQIRQNPNQVSAVRTSFQELDNIKAHFKDILTSGIAFHGFSGHRICDKCKSGTLSKIDDFTFKCRSCGEEHEL